MEHLSDILSGCAIIVSIASFFHARQIYKHQKLKDKIAIKQNILNISNDITFTLEHNINYLEDRISNIKIMQNMVLIEGLDSKLNAMLRTIQDEINKQHEYLQRNDKFINTIIHDKLTNLDYSDLSSQLELKKCYLNNFKILSNKYNTFYKILDDVFEGKKS